MDPASAQQWYLRKHEEGNVFGPLTFGQLRQWASAARIAPHDLVSSDQAVWIKAPMMAELEMDWLVEVTSESFYGPTTMGAIREFMRIDEISEDTFVINTCDGTRQQLRNLEIATAPPTESDLEAAAGPAASRMSIDPQARILDLEQALREERRALAEVEERCRHLETQLKMRFET